MNPKCETNKSIQCKTCNDTKWLWDLDMDSNGIEDPYARKPCPDCNKDGKMKSHLFETL